MEESEVPVNSSSVVTWLVSCILFRNVKFVQSYVHVHRNNMKKLSKNDLLIYMKY